MTISRPRLQQLLYLYRSSARRDISNNKKIINIPETFACQTKIDGLLAWAAKLLIVAFNFSFRTNWIKQILQNLFMPLFNHSKLPFMIFTLFKQSVFAVTGSQHFCVINPKMNSYWHLPFKCISIILHLTSMTADAGWVSDRLYCGIVFNSGLLIVKTFLITHIFIEYK